MMMSMAVAMLLAAAHLQGESRPPGTEVVEETRRGYSFTYTYPLEAAAIPALNALLREEARQLRTQSRGAFDEFRREFGRGSSDLPPHEFSKEWRVHAHLPELISLTATSFSYTGGAHGMSAYDQLIWDRSARERIGFEDLFSDPQAAVAAMTPQFCALLDAERARRREGEAGRDDCPPITDHPVALVTGPSGRIETFQVLIDPYAAGSYAEGTYEISVPVSDAVLQLVRAKFGTAFVWR